MKKIIVSILFFVLCNTVYSQEFSISKLKQQRNGDPKYLEKKSSAQIQRHEPYRKKRDISISFNFGSHHQNYNLYGLVITDDTLKFPGTVIRHIIYGQSLYALVRLETSSNEYVFYIIDLYGNYYTRTFHMDWSETMSPHALGHPRTFVILNYRYVLLNCLRDSFTSSGSNVFLDCYSMRIIDVEKYEL